MFASPLFWQIRYLVSNLNKKNQQATNAELNQLVNLYGQDARIFLISCLVDETDFRDQKAHGNQQKDVPKILLLTHEVNQASRRPNFVSLICQALEGSGRDGRNRHATSRILEENFLANFCRTLKLTTQQQIEIAVGLAQSTPHSVALIAIRYLRTKLNELDSTDAAQLSPHTLFSVIHMLKTSPEFINRGQQTAQLVQMLRQSNPDYDTAFALLPMLSPPSSMNMQPPAPGRSTATATLPTAPDVALFVRDLGYSCTASAATFRAILSESDALPLKPAACARLLLLFATSMTGLENDMSAMLCNSMFSTDENFELLADPLSSVEGSKDSKVSSSSVSQTWDLDVVVEVLKSEGSGLNWQEVAEEVDQPDLVVKDLTNLTRLVVLYRRVSSESSFPTEALLKPWKNISSQLSLLAQAVDASPEVLIFGGRQIPAFGEGPNAGNGNKAWCCMELVELLLTLGESQHMAAVKDILVKGPVRRCPEQILLTLAHIGLTKEVDSLAPSSLMGELLPPYFQPNGSPHALALVRRLWDLDYNLVLRLCRQAYTSTPRLGTVQHLIKLVKSVPDGPSKLMTMPERELVFAVACVLGDNQELSLDEWVLEQIKSVDGTSATQAVLSLVKRHAPNVLPRATMTSASPPVSLESLTVLLKLLHKFSSPYPALAVQIKKQLEKVLKLHPVVALQLQPPLGISPDPIPNGGSQISADGGAAPSGGVAASSMGNSRGTNGVIGASGNSQQPASQQTQPNTQLQQQQPTGPPGSNPKEQQPVGVGQQQQLASQTAPQQQISAPAQQQAASSDEIEDMANSYFQKIYTSEQSIAEVIDMLKKFKTSPNQREQEIFACMIHNLFDEYRFFHKYPEKELRITGILFGTLIQHQLVSSITLGIALRYVLEALRKAPGSGANGKMFRFGMFALEQFKARLYEWPQYCSHIVQIDHLCQQHAELVDEIQRAMKSSKGGGGDSIQSGNASSETSGGLGSQGQQDPSSGAGGSGQLSPAMTGMPQSGVGNGGPPIPPPTPPQQHAIGGPGTLIPSQLGPRGGGFDSANRQTAISSVSGPGAVGGGSPGLKQLGQGVGISPSLLPTSRPGVTMQGTMQTSSVQSTVQPKLSPIAVSPGTILGSGISNAPGGVPALGGGMGDIHNASNRSHGESIGKPSLSHHSGKPGESLSRVGENGGAMQSPALGMGLLHAPGSGHSGVSGPDGMGRDGMLHTGSREVLSPDRGLLMEAIMPGGAEPLTLLAPGELVLDRIHLVFNNVSMQNLDQKASETRGLLKPEYMPWFGNYLVVKRISTQPNFHLLYLSFLLKLDQPDLLKTVLVSVFHNVSKLLGSPKITTSTSERSLLKNLGSWLGQITLARNKPILQRRLDVKELLCQGFETGRLIAVTPFVAKIMEGAKESRVFRPPNPWLMSLMGILRELYDIDDLKMNIKFEIEVLCKHLGLKIDEVPRATILATRLQPHKDKNPDFNVRSAPIVHPSDSSFSGRHDVISDGGISNNAVNSDDISASSKGGGRSGAKGGQGSSSGPQDPSGTGSTLGSSAGVGGAAGEPPGSLTGDGSGGPGETLIPNLGAYVNVNMHLPFFVAHPALKSVVPIAVDRAIREIIQPVVERSVTIACITSKELIVKDFATESSEPKMRKAAQLMVSNLAGSLAVVTCKEPLRLSMANYLRAQFQSYATTADAVAVEAAIQACGSDNLELGCMLIEKAATEKALRDMDDALAPVLSARRKQERNQTGNGTMTSLAVDAARLGYHLPEPLRINRLGPQHLLVYEAFQRKPPTRTPTTEQQDPQQSMQSAATTSSGSVSVEQAFSMYQRIMANLDAAMSNMLKHANGRQVSLDMVGSDHEVPTLTRQVSDLVGKITPATDREPTAYQFAQSIFFKHVVEVNELLKLEVLMTILGSLKEECPKMSKDMINWISYLPVNDDGDLKQHRSVLVLLLRNKLVKISDVDMHLAVKCDGGRAAGWVDLAVHFVHHVILQKHLATLPDLANVVEVLGKAVQRGIGTSTRKISKLMEDLRASGDGSLIGTGGGTLIGGAIGSARPATVAMPSVALPVDPETIKLGKGNSAEPVGARDQVISLLEQWIRVWNEAGGAEKACVQFLTVLQQQGVLKTDESTEVFLRIAIELVVEACFKSKQITNDAADGSPSVQYSYNVLDALSSMLVILVKYASADPQSLTSRVHLLNRILSTIIRVLTADAEARRSEGLDQRPYFRLLVNLLKDLTAPDPVVDANNIQVLGAFATAFHALQPTALPSFAFAWLELVSHRAFMPALLLSKPAQKGWLFMHKLLVDLFAFLEPYLRRSQLPNAVRTLYKGTLRVLLVLLHDFPEFLCDYHFSFCDVIPASCIQLRNLFLSAFPRAMRLPDPFTPNLKVDLLPEISQPPRILSNYMAALSHKDKTLRPDLDQYLKNRRNASFLDWLPDRLRTSNGKDGFNYNVPAMNSLVVYVGTQAIAQLQNKSTPITHSAPMDIFQHLVGALDAEGRYLFLNAIANQLRYPNNHTHYFSCVLLYIFAEANNEFIQEQITRVLLERLIVHRPHPWGLLITFIELIKNPRYNFWAHSFTHCAQEIERVFESVARSCMGPGTHVSPPTSEPQDPSPNLLATTPTQ